VETDTTPYGMDTDAPSLCADYEQPETADPQEPEPALTSEDLHAVYRSLLSAGDTKAAAKLQWDIALANENLIWWWARRLWRRWTPHSLRVQDLAHYGMFGMLRAVEKYRPSFQTKLSSYAGWWIRRSIDSAVFENGPTIRIPEYRINQKALIDAVTLELLDRGEEPSLERIARELNTRENQRCRERTDRKPKVWTAGAVDEVNLATLQLFSSLDQSAYGDSSEELHSYIAPSADEDRHDTERSAPLLRQGFNAIVASSGLSERDKLILELYFYAESRDKATVARLFGVTKQKFGAMLGDFLEQFPELFKLANAQDSDFLTIIDFANLPESQRRLLQQHYCASAAAPKQPEAIPDKLKRVLGLFEKEHSSLYAIVSRRPDLMDQLLRFAQWPPAHRMMLGVFFSRGDLKKQDIATLCNVSRERVRQIIDDFSRKHRGPLSRLFMGDFESAQEVCEKHVQQLFTQRESAITAWLKKNRLAKSTPFLKMVFIERLPRKTIAERCGGLQPGTMTNRLTRAAERLAAAPAEVLPFFCNGIVSLSPREILARQMWELLEPAVRDAFRSRLAAAEQAVFDARLALGGSRMTLRELCGALAKKHASDVAGIFDPILNNFFETASQHIKKQPVRQTAA